MSTFFERGWFTVLSHLGKPVELLHLANADHVRAMPAYRTASQQGNRDWFCFWLKGEEDGNPAKTEQYVRWRELRTLQEEDAARTKARSCS